MADNYLEKKFEEHFASRKSTARRSPASLRTVKPDHIQIHFPPRRVFVTSSAGEIANDIIEAFRKANCSVAFCDTDYKRGTATAQRLGARFYPISNADAQIIDRALADAAALWGGMDIIVNMNDAETLSACASRLAQMHESHDVLSRYGRIISISDDQCVEAHTLSLAKTLNHLGITANCIAPTAGNIASLCIYLALPESILVNGRCIG